MLNHMVFDGKLVDRANLGTIDHLLCVSGRHPGFIPISIEKGFQVLVQILMELLYGLTFHLLVGILPESHLKIPLRLHFLGYFSNPFHSVYFGVNSVVCFFTFFTFDRSHILAYLPALTFLCMFHHGVRSILLYLSGKQT